MLPVQNLLNFVKQHQLFNPGDRLLAAVSGGRDSVVLAHLLKQAGVDFGIAHCNFQLRPQEAHTEQQFTEKLAGTLQVPFHTVAFDTLNYARQKSLSTQMAARELRYEWFEQVRNKFGYSYIAVAHHQNDSVETILLNLTRGTGIAGMHGILPKNGLIVRPLLCMTRDEIDALVAEQGFEYLEDSSNASTKYARNKIRLEVIPRLKELNPKLEDTFSNNLKRFAELETLLEIQVEQLRRQLLIVRGDEIYIDIEPLKRLQPQRLLLFGLLRPYGFSEHVITELTASLHKHPGRSFEAPGYVILLDRERLILTKRNQQHTKNVLIKQSDKEVTYSNFKLTLLHDDSGLIVRNNPLALSVNAELLIYPLMLRSWQQGDFFFPLGMRGKKKLSDYFVSEKIPLHQKQQIPVLVNGNGDVIWVAGHRPDERYKVNADTKKVIIFELYKLTI